MLTLALVLALHACPQRIVVTAPSVRSTTASLSLLECGRRVAGPFRARAGYAGFSAHRHRGRRHDAARHLRDRADALRARRRPRRARSPTTASRCGDWWDGDPRSPTYNRFRHVACGAAPPFGGAERAALAQPGRLPGIRVHRVQRLARRPGRGSAIFLHDDLGHATNGCLSLPRPRLSRCCGACGPVRRSASYCIILILSV